MMVLKDSGTKVMLFSPDELRSLPFFFFFLVFRVVFFFLFSGRVCLRSLNVWQNSLGFEDFLWEDFKDMDSTSIIDIELIKISISCVSLEMCFSCNFSTLYFQIQ